MIMQTVENLIFRKAAPMAIRHLAQPDLKTDDPLSRKVLDQASREFQLAPPVTLHASAPELMAGVWSVTREAYLVDAAGRARREAVASAVSTLNQCPYCVTVHASMYAATGGKDDMETDVAAAHQWAKATLSPDDNDTSRPEIGADDIPQIYGTAFIYHYINRMVSVFLGDSPVALPGMTSAPGEKLARAGFAFIGKRLVALDPEPGQSPGLKEGDLPKELQWATSNPAIARALASFAAIAEEAGETAVPKAVRDLVLENLANWRGEQPPLSRAWIAELVEPLGDAEKSVASLALLTARAPWQIDEAIISAFRAVAPKDSQLVQVTGWASYSAAKQVAGWFSV